MRQVNSTYIKLQLFKVYQSSSVVRHSCVSIESGCKKIGLIINNGTKIGLGISVNTIPFFFLFRLCICILPTSTTLHLTLLTSHLKISNMKTSKIQCNIGTTNHVSSNAPTDSELIILIFVLFFMVLM